MVGPSSKSLTTLFSTNVPGYKLLIKWDNLSMYITTPSCRLYDPMVITARPWVRGVFLMLRGLYGLGWNPYIGVQHGRRSSRRQNKVFPLVLRSLRITIDDASGKLAKSFT